MGLTPSLSRPQVATEEYCWLGGLVIYFHYQCHVTGILKTQSLFFNFYTALVLIKKKISKCNYITKIIVIEIT